MKIILVDVASVDGKLTKGSATNIHEWTSQEDFVHFQKVKSENNLLVMGSGTFENAEVKPEKDRLRIVLTSNPEKYMQYEVMGQLEFSNDDPKTLIERLEKKGFKQMLLVSGGRLATSFFEAALIDELWLTVEPRIFGTGEPIIAEKEFDIQMKLLSLEKLNEQGTLLLKYRIIE